MSHVHVQADVPQNCMQVICPNCRILIALPPGMPRFLCPRCRTECMAPPMVCARACTLSGRPCTAVLQCTVTVLYGACVAPRNRCALTGLVHCAGTGTGTGTGTDTGTDTDSTALRPAPLLA